MKRLFYPPPIGILRNFFLLVIIIGTSTALFGEGSKDFRDYPGHRLFYNVEQDQQLKVYAAEGEFINLGSSHVDINGGTIEVYNPAGVLVATFDGSDGSTAIIFNDIQEQAGPTGGGTAGGIGYTPGVVQVPIGQGGVWSIRLRYPAPFRLPFFSDLLNGDPWDRATDQPQDSPFAQRVALAWDVTVSQGLAGNDGGTIVEGRLYSNEFISILDGNDRPGNPRSTSPTLYILTRAGYLYEVNFDRADPWGFPIHSNSLGLVDGDFNPIYMSAFDSIGAFIRSDNPAIWTSENTYLYAPQAEDFGPIINNKIFFNIPDSSLPSDALVTDTDPTRNNTHTTWLRNELPTIDGSTSSFTFRGVLPDNSPCGAELAAEVGAGGFFVFESELAGQAVLSLDLNNNGVFTDEVDLQLTKSVEFGVDSIFWDGNDGTGTVIPANASFIFNYDLTIRGGEIHVLMSDVENNFGGVTFTRMNGPDSPDGNFFYDHSDIGGEVSGGGTPGNPLPTTTGFIYADSFGNEKLLDQWAFIETNNFGSGTLTISIEEDCTPDDNDEDGIPDIVDIDDDNDGVPDLLEFCHPDEGFACLPSGLDPSGDEDSDGIPNYTDADDEVVNNGCTDEDANGICDQIASIYDTDGDNIPDHLDLDSDNDGISDLVEAGHGQADADGDGVIDGVNELFGDNGLFDALETDDTPTGVANYTPFDADSDGIPDHDDLDSDNDGISDVVEAGHGLADVNGDGRIDFTSVNPDGLVDGIDPAITGVGIPLPIDWDGDGVPDWHDLDSDNDGIVDVIEAGHELTDANGDGRIDFTSVNSDGLVENINPDNTGVGIPFPQDVDSDGVPDWHDLDSDNDGIVDVIEAGHNQADTNGDGIVDFTTVNEDGLVAGIDPAVTGVPVPIPVDVDSDGVPDWHDLDSDNDGIPDVKEAGHGLGDADGDGRIDFTTINQDGLVEGIDPANTGEGVPFPIDWDSDGVPDWHDLDSDNDGILDVIEGGYQGSDTNLDGRIDDGTGGIPPVNSDGLPPIMDPGLTGIPINIPPDTDGDGVEDYHDLDSDNDGINGTVENLNPDGDGDGFIGTGPITVDENGIAIADANGPLTPNTPLVNTDNEGPGDFRDLDADGDGIDDVIEGGMNDPDEDGIVSTGDPEVNIFGQATEGTTSTPPDTDDDGTPDFQQVDSCEDPATPVLASNGTTFCEGEFILFEATGVTGENINYQLIQTTEDGNTQVIQTSTSPNITLESLTLENAGAYTVVAFTDTCFSDASNPIEIDITPRPDAPFLTVDNDVFCEGERLTFMATAPAADNVIYIWTFTNPDGRTDSLAETTTPTISIENLVFTNTGTYNVQVLIDNCPSDISNGVEIDVASGGFPDVELVSSNPIGNPACEGDDVTLSVTEIEGATYMWVGPEGVILLETTPTIILEGVIPEDVNGEYSVTITANGCPETFGPVSVEVQPKPETPTLGGFGDVIICSGEPVLLFADEVEGDQILYEWLQNGVVIATTDVPSLEVIAAGSYSLVIRDGICPSDPSEPVEVTVEPPLEGDITSDPIDGACEGETLTLTAPAAEGATYEWTGPNGFISDEPSIVFENISEADNGDYSVVVTTINGCENDFGPVSLLINPKPESQPIESDSDVVCPGDAVLLSTSLVIGESITYDWLFNGMVIATTDGPSFEITDFQAVDAGDYSVVIREGSCPSDPSDPISIAIQDALEGVTASANSPVCVGDPVNLTVTTVEGATYEWSGPNGFSSTEQNPVIENASEANAGEYEVIVTSDGCPASIPPVNVEVSPQPATPTIELNEDMVCEGTNAIITVIEPAVTPDMTTYIVLDMDGTTVASSNTNTIEVPTGGLSGTNTFTVIAQDAGGCPSEPSNQVTLEVIPLPDEEAMILDPGQGGICGEAPTTLEAVEPTQGTGMWSSDNPDIIFSDAGSPITDISGLAEGDNVITWSLSNELCGVYSTDQIVITIMMPDPVVANDDSFTILNTESISGGNIVGNDSPMDGSVTIIDGPSNGTATLTGNTFNYTPNEGFVGTDIVVYELCNTTCPDIPCDQATITITVDQDPDNLICEIPDVITPNNDNLNDALVIPCSDFKNVSIRIFNRWGDEVFSASNYQNDWIGTHDGEPLPPGPYYYIFEEQGVEPVTGCVSIAR